nr:unnamed protein product [Digitaria exilis]
MDDDVNSIRRRFIDGFYEEASRRLPLKEIPGLEGCICAGGLCVGLADPVANIILNAVGLLLHDRQEQEDLPPPQRQFRVRRGSGGGWADIAYRSLDGLRGFMTAYFRYLDYDQAARYLYVASHNLPLAIALARRDSTTSKSQQQKLQQLRDDGGNLRDALRVAAVQAKHPAPVVMVRLMTAQYPSGLLAAVVAKLQGTEEEPLTARDVSEVMGLLANPWPPATPPLSMDFWCRPNNGSTTCTRGDDGTLTIATCVGDDGRVATLTIPPPAPPVRHRHAAAVRSTLRRLAVHAPTTAQAACLLDAIQATYIRALAVLPSCSPRLLRALLVAGHCYGPMDPVSNIVVSTAWYDMAFPLAEPDQQLPQGILDTKPIYRLASRSLQGLVAMASTHESLELLHSLDCDLSRCHGSSSSISYAAAAKAAKHPQHAAFGSFLASLTNDKLARLSCVVPAGGGVISEAQWRQLNTILDEQSYSEPVPHHLTAPICLLSPSGSVHVSNKKFYFKAKLDFVHSELKKLLHRYCYQHPWLAKAINDYHHYGYERNDTPVMAWTQRVKPSFAWDHVAIIHALHTTPPPAAADANKAAAPERCSHRSLLPSRTADIAALPPCLAGAHATKCEIAGRRRRRTDAEVLDEVRVSRGARSVATAGTDAWRKLMHGETSNSKTCSKRATGRPAVHVHVPYWMRRCGREGQGSFPAEDTGREGERRGRERTPSGERTPEERDDRRTEKVD